MATPIERHEVDPATRSRTGSAVVRALTAQAIAA